MNGTLFVAAILVFILSILISGFVGMHMQERYEHELRIACVNAGKTLIDGNCINGDTK